LKVASASRHVVVIHLSCGLKRPKRRRDLRIDTGTVPRRTIRRSPLAQQLPNLWWREQQPKASVPWKRGEVQRFACGVPALPSTRPDSTVVVCIGRNWAALGSPFFYLSCSFLWGRRMKQPSRIKSIALLLRSNCQKRGVLCNRFAAGWLPDAICSAPDSSGCIPWRQHRCPLRPQKQTRWHSESLTGSIFWPYIQLLVDSKGQLTD
jgi:hypothetical protein